MTRPYAEVIGDPIAQSKSPIIHNFWLQRLGIDAEYRACHVRPEELVDYFTRRRGDAEWRGCNVTMPHKIATFALIERKTTIAEAVGAANCVSLSAGGLIATNTDVAGVTAGLPNLLSREAACVIGAGGAACAAIHALKQHSLTEIRILVRNRVRAKAALKDISDHLKFFEINEAVAALAGVTRIIQASPAGMRNQAPLSPEILSAMAKAHPDSFCLEMVYDPAETPFLKRACERGFFCNDGFEMLIGQADEAFRLFFGQPAPRQHDAELRALLT